MPRKVILDNMPEDISFDDLVSRYILNKQELDSYKKLVETDNTEIKNQMKARNITTYTVNDYIVKYITSQKESINENKLIEVLKQHNVQSVVKTKEYVDFDALESMLYNTENISDELISDIDSCRNITETVSLRINKKKEKKDVRE